MWMREHAASKLHDFAASLNQKAVVPEPSCSYFTVNLDLHAEFLQTHSGLALGARSRYWLSHHQAHATTMRAARLPRVAFEYQHAGVALRYHAHADDRVDPPQ
jgi:hypothetical protein